MTSTQMPSRCTVSTTGHAAPCPNGERATSAASSRTIATCSSASSGGAGGEYVGRAVGRVVDDPDALAVVAAAGRLEHDRPADLGRERGEVGRRARPAPSAGTACPARPAAARIAALSCAKRSAAEPGRTATPSAASAAMCSFGTCSWSKVTTSQPTREGAQVVQRAVVADHDVRRDERGAVVGRVGEDAQRLAEGDRGLVGHPRELAGAHHADDGQPGARVHDPEPNARPVAERCAEPAARLSGPRGKLSRVMTSLRPSTLREYLRGSWRILLKEISAFGIVGALALVIDSALFAWLVSARGAEGEGACPPTVSTTFAYFGNRHLSFSHRARTSIGRETSFFFGINLITLVFSELIIALFVYVLDYGHASSDGLRRQPRHDRARARCSASGPTSGSCSCTRTGCTSRRRRPRRGVGRVAASVASADVGLVGLVDQVGAALAVPDDVAEQPGRALAQVVHVVGRHRRLRCRRPGRRSPRRSARARRSAPSTALASRRSPARIAWCRPPGPSVTSTCAPKSSASITSDAAPPRPRSPPARPRARPACAPSRRAISQFGPADAHRLELGRVGGGAAVDDGFHGYLRGTCPSWGVRPVPSRPGRSRLGPSRDGRLTI